MAGNSKLSWRSHYDVALKVEINSRDHALQMMLQVMWCTGGVGCLPVADTALMRHRGASTFGMHFTRVTGRFTGRSKVVHLIL
jgi:hypothetical protein